MKILALGNNDVGMYLFRADLLIELMQRGNDVYIAVPNGDCVEKLEAIGCKVIISEMNRRGINPIEDFNLYRLYKRIINMINPDLVITYTIKPNIYGGIACRKRRTVYAANITGLGTTFQSNGILQRFVKLLYRLALKNSKVVFFENIENLRIFVDNRIIDKRIACLVNGAGVNLDDFSLKEYPRDEEIRFLFMGRVMAEKGVNELFGAMKKLVNDGYNCKLVVLGYYEENYERIIREYEREGWLKYDGFQADVRPYIEFCHCFVLPSWHEGMANTNLECASMGRPVITSNIHGCLEAVEDGVSGFLCNKQDPDDLYEKMKKFISLSYEERKAMGISGRKRMVDMFDKKKVVNETTIRLFELKNS